MIEIFYVEDYMSGKVLENRYFSDKEGAIKFRNKLGYGVVMIMEAAGHDRDVVRK